MKRDVSVVMAVHNEMHRLSATLESIFAQETVDFELIVVDDGSTDGTLEILDHYARKDRRLRIVQKNREGLTRALIRGCLAACSPVIARVDAGDIFLPGRLQIQYELLERQPDIGLVSCGTRFSTVDGRLLYTVSQQSSDLRQGLSCLELDRVQGPSHHGSTMFRVDLYEQVGGYRAVFRVAQDLDLWLRMYEAGGVLAMPEILYEARMSADAISVVRRREQLATAQLILEGARCRRAGRCEPDYEKLLKRVSTVRRGAARKSAARYAYFVGGCLDGVDSADARGYFRRAWALAPLNLRYGARYLRSLLN